MIVFPSGAFGEMFSKDTLYLDRIPPSLVGKLNASHHYKSNLPHVKVHFWRFQLGCELSYFETKEQIWNSNNKKNAAQRVHGFVDEFADVKESVLFLGGTPHNIGLTPT